VMDPRCAKIVPIILWESASGKLDCPQGCQMVSFQTKNPNLGKVWRALDGKMLLYGIGILYRYLRYFMTIWYILCSFGTVFRFWYHVPRKIWQP
jgi:hypothetical protein